MDFAAWQAQMRKGAAELAVLALLRDGDRYGVQLLQLANAGGELVGEGTLYPLLNRLEREGRIAARWVTGEAPHPRKYYGLTPDGRANLVAMAAAWVAFRTAMTDIVEAP